jgi:hypothetical protein
MVCARDITMTAERFIPDDEQMRMVQWTYVLGLNGVATCVLEAHEHMLMQWARVPHWRVLKRRRLMQQAECMGQLYDAVAEHAKEQDKWT